jgi:flagellar basal body P-ring formation protein FlgA
MRSLIITMILALPLFGLSLMPANAGQPSNNAEHNSAGLGKVTVRESIAVDSHLIKLGDLFTNTGDQAGIEVAYAPAPGKRAVFDARWLYRMAHAYKLSWRPLSDRIRVIVTRQSLVISRQEIEELILIALAEKGARQDTEVELSNRLLRLHVPGNDIEGVSIEEVSFDARSQRFSAVIAAPAGNGTSKRTRVRGRLFTTTEVPVLSRRILAGEVIKAEDLKWVKLRSSRLQSNIIINESGLIGLTPRRGLRAGYPVQLSAVQRPILVAKGSLVTMILRAPKMLLTAQGKALENGAEGDVIRISNSHSKTIIEAEVIASGRVAVRPATLVAMN